MYWHFHSQNLNNDYGPGTPGGIWKHGRFWLHFGKERREWPSHKALRAEWSFGRGKMPALELIVGGEDDGVLLHLGIPGIGLFIALEGISRRLPEDERATGIRLFDGAIWWQLWWDDRSWSPRKDPWYRYGIFRPGKLIFGKEQCERRVLSRHEDIPLPLPERVYRGTITFEEFTWTRPRWPFTRRAVIADIEVGQNAAAIPGKGENVYDLDDDAILSMSISVQDIPAAVGAYVAAVLRARERYGGANWKPSQTVA